MNDLFPTVERMPRHPRGAFTVGQGGLEPTQLAKTQVDEVRQGEANDSALEGRQTASGRLHAPRSTVGDDDDGDGGGVLVVGLCNDDFAPGVVTHGSTQTVRTNTREANLSRKPDVHAGVPR